MSQYYNPQRSRNVYDPQNADGFKLSRSKIDLFLECARCFYLDRRLGVGRPPGFPFNLNSAVDTLLKKEFDVHRAKGEQHPLQKKYGLDAFPVSHDELEVWRENFKGVQYYHEPTGLVITGAIDDLWAHITSPQSLRFASDVATDVAGRNTTPSSPPPQGGDSAVLATEVEYIVVDYKATSKNEEITALDKEWQDGYKRQMEVYQWLLRQKGYNVSDTGYFVYCNGQTDRQAFDAKLEFDITLIPYTGNDSWVEKTIVEVHKCLNSDNIPVADPECDYCNYVQTIGKYS